MALVPSNTNPLQDYVKSIPSMSKDGLVVDGVYGVTGVFDSISTVSNSYPDPNSTQRNSANSIGLPSVYQETEWYSDTVDDVVNTGYELDFLFNRTTYINTVVFDILAVPCTWVLSQNENPLATGSITANNNTWQNILVNLGSTFTFNNSTPLILTLTKTPTGTQYQFGIKSFQVKLDVLSYNDINIPTLVASGVTTQNRLGFIETYLPYTQDPSNVNNPQQTNYWKSSPQPVGDSIVYLIVDFGSTQLLNRMFIDPLYTGASMNLYYSSDENTWYPIQRDMTLKKGVYDLPTINARFLKLEFTSLTAEPYDLPFDSIQKVISVFPDWVDEYFLGLESSIPEQSNQVYYGAGSNTAPNVGYNSQRIQSTIYGLATNQLANLTYGSPNITTSQLGSSSTSSIVPVSSITDPTISYKTLTDISNTGSVYNNIGTTDFITRRFPVAGSHDYKQVIINQTWHQAYFTGIKMLSFFNYSQTVQNDYEEWTDYFLSSSSTIIDPASTASLRANGGYIGLAGTYIQTSSLQTLSQLNGFRIAALNSDWEPLLSASRTVLLDVTGLTTNGVTLVNGQPDTSNTLYGICTFSGSQGTSTVTSAIGGGQNLLSSAQANFTASGWTGSNPTSVAISGVNSLSIAPYSTIPWSPAIGEAPLGELSLGSVSASAAITNNYTFLTTSSGLNGSVLVELDYYGVTASGVFSQSFGVAASGTAISFTTVQPANTTSVRFKLTPSGGSAKFSQAGMFVGTSAQWTSPLITTNMRVSAVARIFLPGSSNGSYRCSLMSNGVELAYRQVSGLPTNTWVDLEVPFTLTGTYTNSTFYVQLTQSNGYGEIYQLALLGLFFNPVAYTFSVDGGSTWLPVIIGVNDPNVKISTPQTTRQLKIRGTLLADNTTISALSIVPTFTQSPYITNTIINYLGDPKVNELNWRRPPSLRPLFQLSDDLHPVAYDISVLMNIPNPFNLD